MSARSGPEGSDKPQQPEETPRSGRQRGQRTPMSPEERKEREVGEERSKKTLAEDAKVERRIQQALRDAEFLKRPRDEN